MILCASMVEIDYFRVQDHLRSMGLGKIAMEKLVEKIMNSESKNRDTANLSAVLDSIAMAKWITAHKDKDIPKRFHPMPASAVAKGAYGLKKSPSHKKK